MRTLKWFAFVNLIYIILGILNVLYLGIPMELVTIMYMAGLVLPFCSKSIAKWLKLDLLWFR